MLEQVLSVRIATVLQVVKKVLDGQRRVYSSGSIGALTCL